MLDRAIDSLIDAAIPNYEPGISYSTCYYLYRHEYVDPDPQDRFLRLLDLVALTNRTRYSGQLIPLVIQPKGDLLLEYQKFITPLVSKLKLRYQQYTSSQFPILDALMRAFVERWLQDLLGTPSNLPDAVLKKLFCPCEDCVQINSFLRSDTATQTFRAPKQRRSHVEDSISKSIPNALTCTTITSGSPHGLQMTKKQAEFTMYKWNGRVASARAFLSLVGTPEALGRIMGDRCQDVNAAVAGTKPYKIRKPVPVVAPAENAPVANTSGVRAGPSGTRAAPVLAGTKRKAE
jgi:hypothetical protein